MQPHLRIRCIRPQLYAYTLSAGACANAHSETTLESLERCLRDACDALGNYFSTVQISLEGQPLGSYALPVLARNAPGLASQLRENFMLVRQRQGRALQVACAA